jgi:hypothetical protein
MVMMVTRAMVVMVVSLTGEMNVVGPTRQPLQQQPDTQGRNN